MDRPIAAWRRAQRQALLARREEVTAETRRAALARIAGVLDRVCQARAPSAVGLYWPIKSEIGLLPWGRALAQAAGATLCLPVVVTPRAPLEYWRWRPGEAMEPGVWNIPKPARREVVLPDLVLAPLVGFDAERYRLGYGGGYFDRTLAAMSPRPFVVGIGYAFGRLDTIFPQPHDIPMDLIVTDADPEER